MNKSKNNEVQEFLDGVSMSDSDKFNSLMETRKLVFETYPTLSEKIMYGGIMFTFNKEDFCGLFVRKNHISFEFSNGYKMNDPKHFLEGKGKFRRHLKIRSQYDIKNKTVALFVKQAI